MTSYLRRFKRGPFWYACFFDANGRMSQVSTKETDKRRAQKIADQYAEAARLGRMGLLAERHKRN
jgi:hypothetical protein